MNEELVLLMQDIAKFVEHGDCYVIKKSDWDRFAIWVRETRDLEGLPDFNMMPISFYFEES